MQPVGLKRDPNVELEPHVPVRPTVQTECLGVNKDLVALDRMTQRAAQLLLDNNNRHFT